jgi:hypothetical protein
MRMLKAILGVILLCLSGLPTFSQSTSEYQVGTITAVAPHQGAAGSDASVTSYDVSVRTGNTVYVVLYTPALGTDTVRYVAGRDLLVLVEGNTITFNDQLGNSLTAPILSRTPVATQSGPASDSAQPPMPSQRQTPLKSVELVGLGGVKDNTGGTLTVEGGKLRFAHSKSTSDIAAAAMEDVVTGGDSQRAVRGTLGTISMFGPYGSGRVLSLFRSKIDSLTIQYRDADGGLHGVIFTLPVGQAELVKKELVTQGAHTSIPTQTETSATSSKPATMEAKQ